MQHIAANSPWCQSRWRLARGWFAILAANPGTPTEEPHWDSKTGGAGLLSWRLHWEPAWTLETGTEEWLSPEPLELLPWEPGGEPWKSSCDMPAGTLDTDPLEVFGKP